MILHLIWAIVVVVIILALILTIFLSPFSDTVKRYTEMKEKISRDKKEVELKKLSIIEKNPQVFKDILNE